MLPVLNRVVFCVAELPSTMAPNEISPGDTVTDVVGGLPLPVAISDTTGLEPAALLVNVITPVTEPAACGVNAIWTVCVAPAASSSGNVGVTTVKPLPLTVLAETSVVLEPGFDICTVWVAVVPIGTLPKNRSVGVTLSAPDDETVLDAVAVTDSVGLLDAFDVNDNVPLYVPLACGLKAMVSGRLLPAGTVRGN